LNGFNSGDDAAIAQLKNIYQGINATNIDGTGSYAGIDIFKQV